KLHAGGMRGVRLSTRVKGYGGMELLEATAARIRPFGWHVQLHLSDGSELAQLEDKLMAMEVPLVFDHFARISGPGATESAGFKSLCRLLTQRDDCWMKLSSYYNFSTAGAPDYADMRPIARALFELRGDRLVWGSNWPHPNRFPPKTPPNEGDLLDVLKGWAPDEAALRKILVDNPAALYGFPEV
ncbi:MAG TPA: amidohydrolase family protein, partial [Burkholderiales bacterium]|nr:amidohydrolase family protein [Burkholderiales bacterium]